jgi:integrase
LVSLQHALALRVSEALDLHGDDFDMDAKDVTVHGRKGHGVVQKAILPHTRKLIMELKKGFTTKRTLVSGARGSAKKIEGWKWPAKGRDPLFPRRRGKDDGQPLAAIDKNTVAKAIIRARATFKPERKDVNPLQIRSHSARHRCVNDLKVAGVPKQMAMTYVLIKDEMTFDRIYGRPTMQQAGEVLRKSAALTRVMAKSTL